MLTAKRLFSALAIITLTVTASLAQEFRGTIAGTVTDPPEPHGRRQRRSPQPRNGAVIKATTNSAGDYVLPFLSIGHYKVTASQAGFKSGVKNDVEIRVADHVEVDFAMEIGAATEQVTVSAQAGLLEPKTPPTARSSTPRPSWMPRSSAATP